MEDESEIESFVGPNASYYMKRFRVFASEGRRYYDANMAAALWSYVWVAYRRMYRWLPVVAVIDLASIGFTVVLSKLAPLFERSVGLLPLVFLAILGSRFVVMGTVADYAYHRFCLGELEKKRTGRPHCSGGVSLLAAALTTAVLAVFAFVTQEANN
ncbi:MAG: hypothetical protein ACK5GN_09535 [Pseudomonadota bacterium]|jgi:hypothetical protein